MCFVTLKLVEFSAAERRVILSHLTVLEKGF